MKKLGEGFVIGIVFLSFSLCQTAMAGDLSLKETVQVLQKAMLQKDMAAIESCIDFNGIIRSKVKAYALRAGKKGFLIGSAGKIVSFSEPVITKAASKYILSEFSKSSPSLRQSYLSSLKINKYWDNGQTGVATGAFMGERAILQALKIKGKWVVVSVDSPLINKEFRNLLKILHLG